MNGLHILSWLLEDAERHAAEYYDGHIPCNSNASIGDVLLELNNRRSLKLPKNFYDILKNKFKDQRSHSDLNADPDTSLGGESNEDLISYLSEFFNNNITFISLILNYLAPEKFFFYRVSKLENEIFSGFKFLSDIIDEFNIPFSKIGRGKNSYKNYIILNRSLHSFANKAWPDIKNTTIIQQRIHYFIYQGLGNLFLTRNDYNQYWIMATNESYFESLDTNPEVNWSGRKEMQEGDLVYMYRQTPRKAITDIYHVSEDPWFDPYGGWNGFWVPLKKITSMKDITMVEMKHDDVLKHWGFVKTSSQGTTTAPVPYFAHNRLLEQIDKTIRDEFNLESEIATNLAPTNEFSTESEFEDKVIDPLLKRWGFKYQRQYPCEFVIGSQHHTCQIDFLVKDGNNENITLFEDKIRIANERELNRAVLQAKSYALQLGIGGFVVASPEGFWIYKLYRNKEIPVAQIAADKAEEIEGMRATIINLKK